MHIPMYNSNPITWNGNRGLVEASDLSVGPAKVPCIQYNTGSFLDIKSHRTGAIQRFELVDQIYNDEPPVGELMAWRLQSLCGTYQLTIFND